MSVAPVTALRTILDRFTEKSDRDLIERAYLIADRAHHLQRRDSGVPYITHPVEAADIVAHVVPDAALVAAALLHDVLEDTALTKEELEHETSPDVAQLVAGVTKLYRLSIYKDTNKYSQENLKKLFFAIARDPRIILIKLADRLSNLRTIGVKKRATQLIKAKEAMDIYAPLAEALGIEFIRHEMEDLAFPVLYPDAYAWIRKKVEARAKENQTDIPRFAREVAAALEKNNITPLQVTGRKKSLYRIYLKIMRDPDKADLGTIHDLVALRIVVADIPDCYAALGVVHQLWSPLIDRLKDYIGSPKANGYQSLHTTVFIPKLHHTVEFQIRTPQMDRMAEFGNAAHWHYSAQTSRKVTGMTKRLLGAAQFETSPIDHRLPWLKVIREKNEATYSAEQLLTLLKKDLSVERIPVMIEGNVFAVPMYSRIVDLAFLANPERAPYVEGASVDGERVPISHVVTPNTHVVLHFGTYQLVPEWLNIAYTQFALEEIRKHLAAKRTREFLNAGKQLFSDALRPFGISRAEKLAPKKVDYLLKRLHVRTLDDVYVRIGEGRMTMQQVLHHLFPKKDIAAHFTEPEQHQTNTPTTVPSPRELVVLPAAQQQLPVHWCSDCAVVVGDPIQAIATPEGVVIHHRSCMHSKTDHRIPVQWAPRTHQPKQVHIHLSYFPHPEFLPQVVARARENNFGMLYLATYHQRPPEPFETAKISCKVNGSNDIAKLLNEIRRMPYAVDVKEEKA